MNNYLIKSYHEVYEDNFNEGEGKHVNSYGLQGFVSAINVEKAVEEYYKNTLFFEYKKENICDNEEDEHVLYDSVSVDVENCEASDYEIEEWKSGSKKLYSNVFFLNIFELVQITTDKFFEKTT